MTKIFEFILNYIFAPIYFIVFSIWRGLTILAKDVMSHLYGKILVPILAITLLYFIIHLLSK